MPHQLRATLRYCRPAVLLIAVFCCGIFCCGPAFAQQTSLSTPAPFDTPPYLVASNSAALESSSLVSAPAPQEAERHKFWDTKNRVLFAAVATFAAADFVVTRSNLQSGGRELNPLVRPLSGSTAGLAVNFAGETAGVIALSYFFHKTGHHKMERFTSMVDASMSGFAVSYGLSHR
jgi:hypothetical protein